MSFKSRREYTYKILTLMDTGVVSPEDLVQIMAFWCSEEDMKKLYVEGPLAEVRAAALTVDFPQEEA